MSTGFVFLFFLASWLRLCNLTSSKNTSGAELKGKKQFFESFKSSQMITKQCCRRFELTVRGKPQIHDSLDKEKADIMVQKYDILLFD